MGRGAFIGQHRTALAAGTALALALGLLAAYALNADGYKQHRALLNDGGIWVVNGELGIHGRINKPIDQLDGVVYDDDPNLVLDVVQDGAAVVTLNKGAERGRGVNPALLQFEDGNLALPAASDVQMNGGTLASIDTSAGAVWATRFDPQSGRPLLSMVDRSADEVAQAGPRAALAVSTTGTVVATSGVDRRVSVLRPTQSGFAEPVVDDLAAAAGSPTAVTTVGERIVTLDASSGQLSVLAGPSVKLPEAGVLQQPGPTAGEVLVATHTELLGIDLDSGGQRVIATANGIPAEPVRLGACAYGAWAQGRGAVAVQCGSEDAAVNSLGPQSGHLAFRVNRDQIVLNDSQSGRVWDVESAEPFKIDNWDSLTAKKKEQDASERDEQDERGDRRPPKALDDSYGVRPARTTILHPLDNDSAPAGRLLSIVSVDQPAGGANVTVGPDGQTIQIAMPQDGQATTFDYYIDDGRSLQASATIRVGVREAGENEAPTLRQGFEPRQFNVPSAGSISVPVLGDWRDPGDGDALLLDSAEVVDSAVEGVQARATSQGRIRFSAPPVGAGGVRVKYTVSDGRAEPVEQTMAFNIQPATDRQGFAPIAEPDAVRGEVGRVIEIRPLANDLPGSDPTTPLADLSIATNVAAQVDTEVSTDLVNGVIDFKATRPGTYFLDYDAAYGNAPMARSKIRVDVRPKPRRPEDPVAMPDTLTVFGQTSAQVDVLANDLDPAGEVLVVQDAVSEESSQLDLSVVDGRWLRVAARGRLVPATQIVRYTITNGTASASGEVSVTQREAPANNTPITVADRAMVRAGSAVSVPVLDNDSAPSGDRLNLSSHVIEAAGELEVLAPRGHSGEVGRAFVAGRMVRFVAPAVTERDTFEIAYVAANSTGETSPGRLLVTVVPSNAHNNSPEPPTLEARVAAGDVTTIKLPGSGVDPEGDPVTITGITSAPRFGRLLSFTANSLRYQAYPGSAGTDEFEYAVVDTGGAVARGIARVAVAAPGAPQPPIAIDDELRVQPGRTATFDPLANDHFAAGSDPVITLINPPPGTELDEETSLVQLVAPSAADAPAVQVVYALNNEVSESRATLTLRVEPGVENPPIVYDAHGQSAEGEAVEVDVLGGAYDPDGQAADLKVVEVFGDQSSTSFTDASVQVTRAQEPRVVAFRVEDGDGTSATAQVFVPPLGHALPYVLPDALIELDEGETMRGKLSDYLVNPAGGTLRLVSRQGASASPAQLSAQSTGDDAFELRSVPGYRGPGALLLEVTTAADASGNEDVVDDSDGVSVLLSVPVQVGDDTPVLDCPPTTIALAAGAESLIDVQTLCEVWTLDPRAAGVLEYQAEWQEAVAGLEVEAMGGSQFRVRAAEDAATERGVLQVRAGNSNIEQLAFELTRAPQPRMLPVPVPDMRAGEARTIDLAPYLIAGVSSPTPRVVSITQVSGHRSPASAAGSSVTLRPPGDALGRVVYRVVMSDVASADPSPGRVAEARLSFEVRGLPGAPTQVTPYADARTGKMRVGWFAPQDTGGSPIQHYQVMELQSTVSRICRQNECLFPDLKTGTRYRFKVRARNAVGYGPWSEVSREAYVDTRPSGVRNIRMVSRGDRSITLAWDEPGSSNSAISRYAINWPGGSGLEISGDRPRVTIANLDNNRSYTFAVQAQNEVGWSDARTSEPMQPLGTPVAPSGVSATDLNTGNASTSVRVSWTATGPEGPGPTRYIVYVSRNGGSLRTVPGCDRIQATTCLDQREYDGASYAYSVRALNSPRPESPKQSSLSQGAVFEAVGRPGTWGQWSWVATGTTQEVQVHYDIPDSRGSTSRVELLVDGVVARSFANQRGSGVITRVNVGSNDQSWPLQLRVCNERAPIGCTTSAVQNVQSFGALTDSLDDVEPPTVNGRTVSWNVTGTSNGNPAVLEVSINGGTPQVIRPGGVGRFSQQVSFTTADYEDEVRLDVRLFDDSPQGRGADTSSRLDRSGPPPVPTVVGFKAAQCSDADPQPQGVVRCRRSSSITDPPCIDAACGHVAVTTQDFLGSFRCRAISDGNDSPWWSQRTWDDFSGNGTHVLHYYFSGGPVSVECESTTGPQQSNSSSFNWS